jgi:capsular polysaccharide biosynthesis protein/Mrp family chromosome partitioning ATPase
MEHYAPSAVEGGTDAVELRRYRDALRRNWLLILAIVVPMTALVFAVSLQLPPTYRSSATIVLGDEGVSRAGGNPELVERALETAERLATTRPVLSAAARRIRGESVEGLAEKVSASASAEANLVRVTAEDRDAAGAARIANAVVVAFLAEKVADERRALAAVRRNLLRQIARLTGTGRKGEIAALRVRLHEVAVNEADAGAGLARADRARPAERPDSPRVLQNTIFALFGFTFLGILVALVREQIAPRVRDAGQLAGLIEAPLLVEMPTPQRWSTSRGEGAEPAYELLQETVQTLLPPSDVQTVLVTASHRERATADIAAGLAEALARAGERSVIVGDIPGRDGPPPPSLSVLLRGLDEGSEDVEQLLELAETRPELLIVSPDGNAPLSSRAQIDTLTGGLSPYGIRYVVVVGRPLLVSRDGPLLPRLVDGVLLVCRPGITTRDDAERLRQLLRASDANVLGVVSLGARQVVPYEVRARATEHGLI